MRLPGLWDCHGHFMGSRMLDLARLPQEPTALRAARSARDLTNALNAGITSVREVGGLGVYLAQAVREGLLDGQHLVALGMTPRQAIEAATATAPRTLGLRAPRSGLLAEGYDADLITVDGDPLADISLLAEPDRITAVWVGGRQVKGNS